MKKVLFLLSLIFMLGACTPKQSVDTSVTNVDTTEVVVDSLAADSLVVDSIQ